LFEFDLDKDVVAYNYLVNNETTYSNSVMPGNYIDVYLRIAKESDAGTVKYTFGKLVENVKVLAVKDGSGRNAFSHEQTRSPAMIIFGVDTETNKYLRTAETLVGNVEIIIVPTDVNMRDGAPSSFETTMTTQELKDYLDDFVDFKEDDEMPEETNTTETNTNVESSSGIETETENETENESIVESGESSVINSTETEENNG
jgi:hypothetical protein